MFARTSFLAGTAAFAFLSLVSSAFTACAEGTDFDDDSRARDAGGDAAALVEAGPSSSGTPSGSSSGGTSSSGGSSGGSSSGGSGTPANCELVINEVSGGADDYVELYNPEGCDDIDLSDYSLVYRASNGQADLLLFDGSSDTVSGGGFYVIGASAFSPKDIQFATGTSLSASAGQLALRSGSSSVDEVGYGDANGTFGEGSNAPAPGTDDAIGRTPDGNDSDDNADDFQVLTPSPGEPN